MFGTARMVDALNINPQGAPRQILTNVREAVNRFVGDVEPFDDLTMMCVEYRGAGNR